jgi:hypothetical protein
MALNASAGADYPLAPAGLHTAVCVDVHDLGMVDTPWGKKHRVAIIWQLGDGTDPSGKPYEVRKSYGLSLGSKAALRADLETWRGKPFTSEQLLGWDVEQVITAQCQVMITHVDKGEKTYANVTAVVPAAKGQKVNFPAGYIRRRDREQKPANGNAADGGNGHADVPEDDCPF